MTVKYYFACKTVRGNEISFWFDTEKNEKKWESWRQTVRRDGTVIWDDFKKHRRRKDAVGRAETKANKIRALAEAKYGAASVKPRSYRWCSAVQDSIKNREQEIIARSIARLKSSGNAALQAVMRDDPGQENVGPHVLFVFDDDPLRNSIFEHSHSYRFKQSIIEWCFENDVLYLPRAVNLGRLHAVALEFKNSNMQMLFKLTFDIGA